MLFIRPETCVSLSSDLIGSLGYVTDTTENNVPNGAL